MREEIIYAVKSSNLQEVIRLLDSGVDVNEKDSYGNSLLSIACTPANIYSPPNINMVNLLLKRGANINCIDRRGNTPLMTCWTPGQREIVRFLIGRGADVNVKNIAGRTALHIFIQHNALASVKILLEHNVNIDEKDNLGNTALHYAIRYYEDMSKLLVNRGANIEIRNNEGETPLELSYRLCKQTGNSQMSMIHNLIDDAFICKEYDNIFKYLAQYCKMVNNSFKIERNDEKPEHKSILNSEEYNNKLQENLDDLQNLKKYLLTLRQSIKKTYKDIADKNSEDMDNQLKDIKSVLAKVEWYIGSVDEFYNKRVLDSVVFPIHKNKFTNLER